MEIAVSPQPVRASTNSRSEPTTPASESDEGFATAVDATLAGADSGSAQQGAPLQSGNGRPNLSSPLIAPETLVAAPDKGATALTEAPQDPSGLVAASAQATGDETFTSVLTEENAGRDVPGSPQVAKLLKNEPKAETDVGKSGEEPPLPPGICHVVIARAIDRAGPGRPAQPRQPAPDANIAEKDDEPAVAAEGQATVASPQILPLSVPKVPGTAPQTESEGKGEREPGTAKGNLVASVGHSAQEIDPRVGPVPRTNLGGDAADFALAPGATDTGEVQPTAPGFTGTEAVRAQLQAPEPKAEPVVAAQPGRFGHDLGVEIARRVAAGGDQLVVRLSPAELGRIEVRMSFDDRGGLSTVFAADNRAALDMLRRDSADLSRALSDAGFRSEASTMRFDTGDRGSGGQPRTPWQNAAPKPGNGTETFEPELLDQTAFRTFQTRGRYDLMA